MMKKQYQGFTLLELMIAVAIFASLSVMIGSFTSTSLGIYAEKSMKEAAKLEAKVIVEKITQELMDVLENRIWITGTGLPTTDPENGTAPADSNNIEYRKKIDSLGNFGGVNTIFYQNDRVVNGIQVGTLTLAKDNGVSTVLSRNVVDNDDWPGNSNTRTPPFRRGISFTMQDGRLNISVSVFRGGRGGSLFIANYQTSLNLASPHPLLENFDPNDPNNSNNSSNDDNGGNNNGGGNNNTGGGIEDSDSDDSDESDSDSDDSDSDSDSTPGNGKGNGKKK